ncbi:ABC transporter substrate-binding protein [Duganella sp. BJB488]|uniref:substrate-binding domain-containing protein n=1 Tax=unclassified Duganella TaxID=2636909 RepID=UPI000E3561C6|nr:MULTISPECIES: substrate-binding domain-containing protein [unclassified Duganella]RFP15427.1 ABC transporter substrate-binding protein [Duganella sp. BJB489]RFP19984.1 ABC transporter substrate-binding protein [Duganella sp. BJB488]RFP38372.1 ABC transporter substrate-binding protein [Duganella sp. BJB480]
MQTSIACAAVLAFAATAASAEQLDIMNSGGYTAAYLALKPRYEAASGDTLVTAWGPSMGKAPEAIPNRLARGEPADVVIMVGYALDQLIAQGKVDPASRTELADSRIGMVVRAGHALPDISTVEAFKATLLGAGSIAYSDSASGVYIERELLKKLDIEAAVKPKAHMVQKTPVAMQVAEGKYELGFQQVSEILPVRGATFVARIPEPLQSVTRFAAGIPVQARHPEAARKLLRFLAGPEARDAVAASGLDPLPSN